MYFIIIIYYWWCYLLAYQKQKTQTPKMGSHIVSENHLESIMQPRLTLNLWTSFCLSPQSTGITIVKYKPPHLSCNFLFSGTRLLFCFQNEKQGQESLPSCPIQWWHCQALCDTSSVAHMHHSESPLDLLSASHFPLVSLWWESWSGSGILPWVVVYFPRVELHLLRWILIVLNHWFSKSAPRPAASKMAQGKALALQTWPPKFESWNLQREEGADFWRLSSNLYRNTGIHEPIPTNPCIQ